MVFSTRFCKHNILTSHLDEMHNLFGVDSFDAQTVMKDFFCMALDRTSKTVRYPTQTLN